MTPVSWGRLSGAAGKFPAAVWALIGLFAICSSARSAAMIVTLPFPDLVSGSDAIVIARVSDKVPVQDATNARQQIKNVLTVECVLKGNLQASRPLELMTVDTKGKWMEDVLALPAIGSRAVLFLSMGSGGRLRAVNGIQGVWPLKDGTDKTLGMGFAYSIAQIKKEIKSPSGRPPKGS